MGEAEQSADIALSQALRLEVLSRVKLTDLKVRDVQFALGTLAERLSTRSVRLARMILIQAIRNAMVTDLAVRNVADLTPWPTGKPGRPFQSIPQGGWVVLDVSVPPVCRVRRHQPEQLPLIVHRPEIRDHPGAVRDRARQISFSHECGSTSMTTTAKPPRTGSQDPIRADDVPSLRRRLLVPTLVLSGSLMAVVSSLGAPLVPTLSRADGVSLSTGEWILTITLLTGALATPVMGRLADGPRQRAVILVALGAVVVGCVLSAVSNGFTVLIIGRALQGVGLGLLPVAMAIARRNLPWQAARRTIATLSVTTAIGVISVAMFLLLPIIVEFVQIPRPAGYGFAASLVVSGLVLIPLSVGSFAASRFLAVYERRFGPRTMIPLGSVVFAVGAMFFALEHSALWEAFVTVAVCGLGVGFTTGAMPGFITRAVAQSETGSAMGFYQVVRSIGLTVGSALSAAVLMAHTRHGQALPDVGGFKAALIIAAALCLATGVISFVLPGRAPSAPSALTVGEEEAELGRAGMAAGEEPLPVGTKEGRP
jgi:MFS family permease